MEQSETSTNTENTHTRTHTPHVGLVNMCEGLNVTASRRGSSEAEAAAATAMENKCVFDMRFINFSANCDHT